MTYVWYMPMLMCIAERREVTIRCGTKYKP